MYVMHVVCNRLKFIRLSLYTGVEKNAILGRKI